MIAIALYHCFYHCERPYRSQENAFSKLAEFSQIECDLLYSTLSVEPSPMPSETLTKLEQQGWETLPNTSQVSLQNLAN